LVVKLILILHSGKRPDVAILGALRNIIRTGPGVPPGFGLQPLGTARPKPAISFRSLRGIARQAITTAANYNNNSAAVRLTSSTQGAGVLLSYCLSCPVQSFGSGRRKRNFRHLLQRAGRSRKTRFYDFRRNLER